MVFHTNSTKQIYFHTVSLSIVAYLSLNTSIMCSRVHFKAHISSINAGSYVHILKTVLGSYSAYKGICVGAFLCLKMWALLVLRCSTYLWKNIFCCPYRTLQQTLDNILELFLSHISYIGIYLFTSQKTCFPHLIAVWVFSIPHFLFLKV